MDKYLIPTTDLGVNAPVLRRSARLNRPAAGADHEGNFILTNNY